MLCGRSCLEKASLVHGSIPSQMRELIRNILNALQLHFLNVPLRFPQVVIDDAIQSLFDS